LVALGYPVHEAGECWNFLRTSKTKLNHSEGSLSR
jgi:hypothetical protein